MEPAREVHRARCRRPCDDRRPRIVTDFPAAARIFQKYRIDFCCQATCRSQACAGRGLDAQAVADELARALAEDDGSLPEDVSRLTTPELIAYVVRRHHAYLREALPYVLPLAAKVAHVHGDRNPALAPLLKAVQALERSLVPHLDQEEAELFPGLTAGSDPNGRAGSWPPCSRSTSRSGGSSPPSTT